MKDLQNKEHAALLLIMTHTNSSISYLFYEKGGNTTLEKTKERAAISLIMTHTNSSISYLFYEIGGNTTLKKTKGGGETLS